MLAVKYKYMVAMVLTTALRYVIVWKYISVSVGARVCLNNAPEAIMRFVRDTD